MSGSRDDAPPRMAGEAEPGPSHPRRIRSFVTRAGRMSPAQQRARDELGHRFVLPYRAMPLDLAATFGRSAPTILEIGFGMGAATAAVAAAHPELDFLGIEVHGPGVGALLKQLGELALTNVRIVEHDAVDVVREMLIPDALAGVHIWFPDPWHKARHNKRRLIQPEFVRLLVARLASNAFVHCATDWEDYARQMLEVFSADLSLNNVATEGFATAVNPRVSRPVTKFERRGQRLGHGVWDLIFTKR